MNCAKHKNNIFSKTFHNLCNSSRSISLQFHKLCFSVSYRFKIYVFLISQRSTQIDADRTKTALNYITTFFFFYHEKLITSSFFFNTYNKLILKLCFLTLITQEVNATTFFNSVWFQRPAKAFWNKFTRWISSRIILCCGCNWEWMREREKNLREEKQHDEIP